MQEIRPTFSLTAQQTSTVFCLDVGSTDVVTHDLLFIEYTDAGKLAKRNQMHQSSAFTAQNNSQSTNAAFRMRCLFGNDKNTE